MVLDSNVRDFSLIISLVPPQLPWKTAHWIDEPIDGSIEEREWITVTPSLVMFIKVGAGEMA
jgi:hypothetical protein